MRTNKKREKQWERSLTKKTCSLGYLLRLVFNQEAPITRIILSTRELVTHARLSPTKSLKQNISSLLNADL